MRYIYICAPTRQASQPERQAEWSAPDGTPRHALACPRQPPPLPATKIQESLDASFDWPGVRKCRRKGRDQWLGPVYIV